MGLRVFDFRCPAGHVTEHFVEPGVEEVACHCECRAERQIAAPRAKLDPFTGHFPGAADKWVRDRESHMAKERKNLDAHGSYK
jgi:hypothetical protein